MFGIERSNGRVVWSWTGPDTQLISELARDGQAYCREDKVIWVETGHVHVLLGATGKWQWSLETVGRACLFDDRILARTSDVAHPGWIARRYDGAESLEATLAVGLGSSRLAMCWQTGESWSALATDREGLRLRLADGSFRSLAASLPVPRRSASLDAARSGALWFEALDGTRQVVVSFRHGEMVVQPAPTSEPTSSRKTWFVRDDVARGQWLCNEDGPGELPVLFAPSSGE